MQSRELSKYSHIFAPHVRRYSQSRNQKVIDAIMGSKNGVIATSTGLLTLEEARNFTCKDVLIITVSKMGRAVLARGLLAVSEAQEVIGLNIPTFRKFIQEAYAAIQETPSVFAPVAMASQVNGNTAGIEEKKKEKPDETRSVCELDEPADARVYRSQNGIRLSLSSVRSRKKLLLRYYSLIQEGLITIDDGMVFNSLNALTSILQNSDLLRCQLIPLKVLKSLKGHSDESWLRMVVHGIDLMKNGKVTYDDLAYMPAHDIDAYFNAKLQEAHENAASQSAAEALTEMSDADPSANELFLREEYNRLEIRIAHEKESSAQMMSNWRVQVEQANQTHARERRQLQGKLSLHEERYQAELIKTEEKDNQLKAFCENAISGMYAEMDFSQETYTKIETCYYVHSHEHDQHREKCSQSYAATRQKIATELAAVESEHLRMLELLEVETRQHMGIHLGIHHKVIQFLQDQQQRIQDQLTRLSPGIPFPVPRGIMDGAPVPENYGGGYRLNGVFGPTLPSSGRSLAMGVNPASDDESTISYGN